MSKKNDKEKDEIIKNEKEESNMETIINLKIDTEPNKNNLNDMEILKPGEGKMIDKSVIALKNDESHNIEILNKFNNENKEEVNNAKKKTSFMQNAKAWFGKTWNNIKNYDYSKLNIFKGEEMEDCLDAHGFPMKIPKRRHYTKPEEQK